MQQGHDNEIAALYAENRVALLRRAYKYMNDWDAASDVVQTSMLKFIRMFGKLSRPDASGKDRLFVHHCAPHRL